MCRRDVISLVVVIVAPWVLTMFFLVIVDLISWSTFIATVSVSTVGSILIGATVGSSDDYSRKD